MTADEIHPSSGVYPLGLAKALAFVELLKVRLSLLVAISCAVGYSLASTYIDYFALSMITLGAFLMSGASVCINQILERDLDKLMKRTQARPLPTNRVSVEEAIVCAACCFVLSVVILWLFTNPVTVYLSIVSLLLYAFAYTPLKRVGPFAVFVGAIPGALPPLLGWIAATGHVTYEALLIFGIQFIWQFPHFWSIAWVADEDYKKAGFKLLPSGGEKSVGAAMQIALYSLFLVPTAILPAQAGITGMGAAVASAVVGVALFVQSLLLARTRKRRDALRVMIGSFLYLPLIWVSFLIDKLN